MKHITIIMPLVKECSVSACGFNAKDGCHAKAITVGGGTNPGCDTFFNVPDTSAHAKSESRTGGVGACKVSGCKFNTDYECVADEIMVSMVSQKAKCATYAPR